MLPGTIPSRNTASSLSGITQRQRSHGNKQTDTVGGHGKHLAKALIRTAMRSSPRSAVSDLAHLRFETPQIGRQMTALKMALSADLQAVKNDDGTCGSEQPAARPERYRARVRQPAGTRVSALATQFVADDLPHAKGLSFPRPGTRADMRGVLEGGKVALSGSVTPEQSQLLKSTGISHGHAVRLQTLANETNSVIGVRKVEQAALRRIEEGAQTKNLSVKGKSADWGLHSGYIPVDQALNKKAGLRERHLPGHIEDANAAMRKLLSSQTDPLSYSGVRDHTASLDDIDIPVARFGEGRSFTPFRAQPLKAKIVSKTLLVTLDELKAAGEVSTLADGSTRFTMSDTRGAAWQWKVVDQGDTDENRFEVHYRSNTPLDEAYKPLEVIAYKFNDGRESYVTADFDLLMVMPHIETFDHRDNVDLPLVTVKAYASMTAPKSYEKIAFLEQVHQPLKRHDHGNSSVRISTLIDASEAMFPASAESGQGADKVNNGVRALIHHSHDMLNPYTDEAGNYPALVVTPGSSTLQVISDSAHFDAVYQNLAHQGYVGFKNPLWQR